MTWQLNDGRGAKGWPLMHNRRYDFNKVMESSKIPGTYYLEQGVEMGLSHQPMNIVVYFDICTFMCGRSLYNANLMIYSRSSRRYIMKNMF